MRGIVGYTGVQSAAPILPEGFLCADAVLRLMTSGIVVNEKVIRKAAEEYLPFITAENIMMEAVRRGGDRQKIHGIIRRCCSRRVTSAHAKNKRQNIYPGSAHRSPVPTALRPISRIEGGGVWIKY